MQLFLWLIAQYLPSVHLPDLLRLGAERANPLLRAKLREFWMGKAPGITKGLVADGWTVDKTTETRPNPPEAYVADILYRAWRRLFRRGALLIDFARDVNAEKITQRVAGQLDPNDHAHNVRAVIEAQVAGLFD